MKNIIIKLFNRIFNTKPISLGDLIGDGKQFLWTWREL